MSICPGSTCGRECKKDKCRCEKCGCAACLARAKIARGTGRSRCAECGAPVKMGRTAEGAPLPVDVEPSATGTVFVRGDGRHRPLSAEEAIRGRAYGAVLWAAHYDTCPARIPSSVSQLQLDVARMPT